MAAMNEEDLVASGRGKWSVAGVPHKGWVCIEIEDLGSPDVQCQMCESQYIRFIHHMEHPDYPEILQVGCVCAGHMEGDLAASRARDDSMRSRAAKRSRWPSRVWKTSRKGNLTIKADGYRVTVYEKGSGWGCTVAGELDKKLYHSRKSFKTVQEAKLAGFDQITRLIS